MNRIKEIFCMIYYQLIFKMISIFDHVQTKGIDILIVTTKPNIYIERTLYVLI